MVNLLYKDFHLSIHKFFLIAVPVLSGALFLIPAWPFFIAFMYLYLVSIPNIFGNSHVQRDNEFTLIMPVGKDEIVKARITVIILLELIHLSAGILFILLRNFLYGADNFLFDTNAAFIGFSLLMYGVCNICFFPAYYKTAFKYGIPTIAAVVGAFVVAGGAESLILLSSGAAFYLEGTGRTERLVQMLTLLAGGVLFAGINYVTVKISQKRFRKVDL